MTGVDVVTSAVAIACLLVLAAKLVKLRRDPGDHALRAQCLMLAALATSVGIQPFVAALDRFSGVQKLGGFIGELALTVAAGAGQVFLMRVYHQAEDGRDRSRRCYRILGLTLVILTVLFVLGAPDPYTAHGETASRAGHLSLIPLPYLYLYPHYLYLAGTLAAVVVLCVRYARPTGYRFLRVGLCVLAAGCALGIVYTLVSLTALSLQEFRVNIDSWKAAVTTPLYLLSDMLVLLGCAVPSLARSVGVIWQWVVDRRAARALQPLWLALCRAAPDIALFGPAEPGEPIRGAAGTRLHLYRQVIEIRDGQLALRPYLDDRVGELAAELGRQAGLGAGEIAAVSEAAVLAVAIAAKRAGRSPSSAHRQTPAPRGGTDLRTEIGCLVAVSRAFTTSPVVARTAALLVD